ncbi:DUF368 domain-containing protein [Halomicrobium salinisoli]|uniref:DUF368 domain-containing protein n=1 Tax=Halomicrobium salinisoli TaxID=2878391 RepID=UPI001CF06A92|nr:DUF368 domain-containing protein [Halomicrobium salinisoli]
MTTADGERTVSLSESVPPLREWLTTFVVGLCMGTADAVPGVSGGTIALIAGVYERLIAGVSAVTPRRVGGFLRALAPVDGGVDVDRAIGIFDEVDGWFLLALLVGIVAALVTVTGIVDWADERYPVLLFGVFFGLIGASAVILLRAISIRRADEIAAAVAGFAAAFVAAGQASLLGGGGLALVFVGGALAVSAMILPGLSGALILVILGQYTRMSETLHAFIDALGAAATGGATADLVDHGTVVVTFVLGGLVGLFTIARVVRRALDANRGATLAFLVALVVGALRAPVDRIGTRGIAWTTDTIVAFAAAAAVGAAVVLVLDYFAVDIDLESA